MRPALLVALVGAGCLESVGEPMPDGGAKDAGRPRLPEVWCEGSFVAPQGYLREHNPPPDGCTAIDGGLTVYGLYDSIVTVSPVLRISQELRVEFTLKAESIRGLDTVESVGSLYMANTHGPTDLRWLSSLNHIRGDVWLQSMQTLTSLDGLEGVEQCEDLVLSSIPALQSLGGLASLKHVGSLSIHRTGLTRLSELSSLQRIDGDVRVSNNPKLSPGEVDAFLARVSIGGKVYLENNGAAP